MIALRRRLLFRIWAHGVLLFIGVVALFFGMRAAMSDIDQAHALRARPYLATALADRILAHAADPAALAAEVTRAGAETPLAVSVYTPSGALLASSVEPALAAPATAELAGAGTAWHHGRFVAASASAVVVLDSPALPSITWHVGALLGCALVLAFVFVAAPLTWSIVRPLERLRSLAGELGAGNLAARSAATRPDEIGELGRAFDAMAGQLQRLRDAERQLLGDVSHELRTPLARMRVVLELASGAEHEKTRAYLGEITTDLAELEQLVDDIITSARLDATDAAWDEARPPLRTRRVAVAELVDATAERFRTAAPGRELTIERGPPGLAIDGDPVMLRRVLDNLLDNARKYSSDDAPVELRVHHDGDTVRFDVIDRGIGIAAEDHARVFTGFFRSDRSRARTSGGVGLGLSLARRIVTAHGGQIGFSSEIDRGSRFWFTLGA